MLADHLQCLIAFRISQRSLPDTCEQLLHLARRHEIHTASDLVRHQEYGRALLRNESPLLGNDESPRWTDRYVKLTDKDRFAHSNIHISTIHLRFPFLAFALGGILSKYTARAPARTRGATTPRSSKRSRIFAAWL